MIEIDFKNKTYVCPYCGCKQSYSNSYDDEILGYRKFYDPRPSNWAHYDVNVLHIMCTNEECHKITVVAQNTKTGKQTDISPKNVHKAFPEYVPAPIRQDYVEAVTIMQDSPKAAATLLRRCLQGMIRDFWDIKKKTLKEEIDELQTRVPAAQWKAIDGLRRLGNIGAHMEKDINLIVDIDEGEANRLAALVELLIDKWYVARHDEEELFNGIVADAEAKKGK